MLPTDFGLSTDPWPTTVVLARTTVVATYDFESTDAEAVFAANDDNLR
jgi:hypothetical protein